MRQSGPAKKKKRFCLNHAPQCGSEDLKKQAKVGSEVCILPTSALPPWGFVNAQRVLAFAALDVVNAQKVLAFATSDVVNAQKVFAFAAML